MADTKERPKGEALFSELSNDKPKDRMIQCASYTMPYLYLDGNDTGNSALPRERVQSFGAKLANNIIGKFSMAVLPPANYFYKLEAKEEAVQAIIASTKDGVNPQENENAVKRQVDLAVAKLEDDIFKEVNRMNIRASFYKAMRNAVVLGEGLIEIISETESKVHSVKNYVHKSDSVGNIIQIVIKESISPLALPDGIEATTEQLEAGKDIDLYTIFEKREDGKYYLYQDIGGEIVGEEKSYAEVTDRFIYVPFNRVDGEEYARGLVEEYLGDFVSLNKNIQLIDEVGVLSARTIFMVNPNGVTNYDDYADADNGDVIYGQEQDISTSKTNKNSDMQITVNRNDQLRRDLAEAFLMGSASVRNADRVTKAEIEMIAKELEASFGGIYTNIAKLVQLPIVKTAINNLKVEIGKDISINILSGLDALGRSAENQKMREMLGDVALVAQATGDTNLASDYLDVSNILNTIAENSGVANKNLIRSQEEVDKIVGQRNQQQLSQETYSAMLNQKG